MVGWPRDVVKPKAPIHVKFRGKDYFSTTSTKEVLAFGRNAYRNLGCHNISWPTYH